MKQINMLLEDTEILIMRGSVRMLELFTEERDELLDQYIKKVLDATDDIPPEYKKEIGMAQRALRRIKETERYAEFMRHYNGLNQVLMIEIEKERNGEIK